MGIFSTIGSVIPGLGPWGTAIGAAVDGVVAASGQRAQVREQNKLEATKFERLRKAAEKGGFHPLEVLRAGGSVNTQAQPRLLTSLSATNAFDALEDEYTGEAAKERHRQGVRDEILERELEIQRAVAQTYRTRPTIGNTADTIAAENGWPSPQDAAPGGGFRTGPNRRPVIGGGNEKDEVEPGNASITDMSRIGESDRTYEDPSRIDATVMQTRFGDAELFNTIYAGFMYFNRRDYNAALSFVSARTGISKNDLHKMIAAAEDPSSMRDALPGRIARSVIRGQEIYDALQEYKEWRDETKGNSPTAIPTHNLDLVSP